MCAIIFARSETDSVIGEGGVRDEGVVLSKGIIFYSNEIPFARNIRINNRSIATRSKIA